MDLSHHGIGISIERIDDFIFISLKPYGKLSHDDYEAMTPMINAALSEVVDPYVTLLADIRELDGLELHAVWDDMKFGFEHITDFKKIAFVVNKNWQEKITTLGSWLTLGKVQHFLETDEALAWLQLEH